MINKKLFVGIIVLALVFGMTVAGCGDDVNGNANTGNGSSSGVGNPFTGTWRHSNSGSTTTITFYADLSLRWVISGSLFPTSTSYGNYSYNGNTAILGVNGGTTVATLNNTTSFNMGGFTFTKQ